MFEYRGEFLRVLVTGAAVFTAIGALTFFGLILAAGLGWLS